LLGLRQTSVQTRPQPMQECINQQSRVQPLHITCPTMGVLPSLCPTRVMASPQAHRLCLNPRHAQCRIRWTPAETSAAATRSGWCGHWWHNRHTCRPAGRCRGRRRSDSYRGHRAESRTWCISWADAPLLVSVAVVAGRQAVAPSWLAPMPPMGHARGWGERPGGRGTHIAVGVTDGQRGCLRSGGAQPGRRGVEGLHVCRGKRDPALLGKTPAAFMSPTIAQHHTVFLESGATAGRKWCERLRREV
jgi:hypothetical protein